MRIVANPTLATPTWGTPANTTAAETACEVDTTGTYTAGSGVEVFSLVVTAGVPASSAGQNNLEDIEIHNSQPIAMIVQNLAGGGSTARADLKWQENW